MKHFYHIRCDPDFGEGFCAMRRIPCACTGYTEQLSKTWLPNLDKTPQPRYVIEPKTCKYFSILLGYNKWYFFNSIRQYTIYYSQVILKSIYMF